MIEQLQLMEAIEKYRGDAVVIPIFQSNRRWVEVTKRPNRDISIAPMGKGSSFALGIALARPDTKVILLDGDGSLEMNLGSLITVAGQRPKNLYHFVIQNGVYATTGGQPIPGPTDLSFSDMAKAAGYEQSYYFDDLEEFSSNAERILNQDGPVMICVRTVAEIRTSQERALQRAMPGRKPPSETFRNLRAELDF